MLVHYDDGDVENLVLSDEKYEVVGMKTPIQQSNQSSEMPRDSLSSDKETKKRTTKNGKWTRKTWVAVQSPKWSWILKRKRQGCAIVPVDILAAQINN